MRRRYIAMRRLSRHEETFEPNNNRLYPYAGQAKNYSKRTEYQYDGRSEPRSVPIKVDDGYVIMIDIDAGARVTFDEKGKPVGIAKDTEPTLLEQYTEAERMLEVWAKEAVRLRALLHEEVP